MSDDYHITVRMEPGLYRAIRALACHGGMSAYIARLCKEHVRHLDIGRKLPPLEIKQECAPPS